MKNLLYKEFKLSVHPLTYFFMALMALSALAPTFPAFVPLVYFGATYTFLFIGMNKTTTTNDLLYTCLLPISRKQVVGARIFSTSVLQLIELVIIFPLFLLNRFVFIEGMLQTKPRNEIVFLQMLNIEHGIALLGVFLICFAVFDLIYLPWFYKNGKSIIANMLTAVLTMLILSGLLTFIPTQIPGLMDALTIWSPKANYIIQITILLFGLAAWIGSKFLVRHLSTKNLVKLDF